jgi:hypothetical protein
MKKNVLTIAVALMILALVTVPAAAGLPLKNPLPPGKPFEVVWTLLQNLQDQISQIKSAPPSLKIVNGRFSGYETIVEVPAGYQKAECTLNAAVDNAPQVPHDMYMQGFKITVYPVSTNEWGITSTGYYWGSGDPTELYPLQGWYIVLCQK